MSAWSSKIEPSFLVLERSAVLAKIVTSVLSLLSLRFYFSKVFSVTSSSSSLLMSFTVMKSTSSAYSMCSGRTGD